MEKQEQTQEQYKALMYKKALDKCAEFEKESGARLVYLSEYGSTLYGLENEDSDMDFKGLFVPSVESVLLKKDKPQYKFSTGDNKSSNAREDLDLQLHSVYEFLKQVTKGETGSLDLLFSMFREDTQVYTDKEFVNELKENYKKLLNRGLQSFVGYSVGQATKYGLKGSRYKELEKLNKLFENLTTTKEDKMETLFDWLKVATADYKYVNFVRAPGARGTGNYKNVDYVEVLGKKFSGDVSTLYFLDKVQTMQDKAGHRTIKASEGTDWKALSHAVRVLLEVEELLDTGFVKFPLTYAEQVKRVKYAPKVGNEEEVLAETLAWLDVSLDPVKEKLDTSNLPEKSDLEYVETLLLRFVANRSRS